MSVAVSTSAGVKCYTRFAPAKVSGERYSSNTARATQRFAGKREPTFRTEGLQLRVGEGYRSPNGNDTVRIDGATEPPFMAESGNRSSGVSK